MKILLIGMNGLKPGFLMGEDAISEQLGNFHRLMEIGCYGLLDDAGTGEISSDFSFDQDAMQDDFYKVVTAEDAKQAGYESETDFDELLKSITAHSRSHFAQVFSILKTGKWNFLQYLDEGLNHIASAYHRIYGLESSVETANRQLVTAWREYYLHLNDQLGNLFENIEDDLVFMVVSNPMGDNDQPGFFILASPNNPLDGEVAGVKMTNIGPTLFELAGYPIPDSQSDQSLVSGKIIMRDPEQLSKEEEEILRERLSGLGYI